MSKSEIFGLCVFSFIMGQLVSVCMIAFLMGATKKPDGIIEEPCDVELPNNITPLRRI